jgi:hypothetical protein
MDPSSPPVRQGGDCSFTSSHGGADEGREGRLSYGIPVPGKPHLVESPYSPGKYVDVEGFPPGTEVKDP